MRRVLAPARGEQHDRDGGCRRRGLGTCGGGVTCGGAPVGKGRGRDATPPAGHRAQSRWGRPPGVPGTVARRRWRSGPGGGTPIAPSLAIGAGAVVRRADRLDIRSVRGGAKGRSGRFRGWPGPVGGSAAQEGGARRWGEGRAGDAGRGEGQPGARGRGEGRVGGGRESLEIVGFLFPAGRGRRPESRWRAPGPSGRRTSARREGSGRGGPRGTRPSRGRRRPRRGGPRPRRWGHPARRRGSRSGGLLTSSERRSPSPGDPIRDRRPKHYRTARPSRKVKIAGPCRRNRPRASGFRRRGRPRTRGDRPARP